MKTSAAKKVVPMTDKTHDAPRDAARPYRLWDAKRKANMRYRYYGIRQNAHMGALVESRWVRLVT